jgi:hypothetical protein
VLRDKTMLYCFKRMVSGIDAQLQFDQIEVKAKKLMRMKGGNCGIDAT